MLDVRALLPLRQLPPLAEGGVGTPELSGVSRPSFPCVRARGKVTWAKSQTLVIYDVKFEKYFANRVAKLAKWQCPRSRETLSLQSLHAMIATMQ